MSTQTDSTEETPTKHRVAMVALLTNLMFDRAGHEQVMMALGERANELAAQLDEAERVKAALTAENDALRKALEAFEPIACWFAMVEAHAELIDKSPSDDTAIFHFMGSGASARVTAGEMRNALRLSNAALARSSGANAAKGKE